MGRSIVFMQDGWNTDSVGKFISPQNETNTGIDPVFPQNMLNFSAEGARRVTWTLRMLAVYGSPTGWKIEARFLYPVASTEGPFFNKPVLVPFDALKTKTVLGEAGLHHPEITSGAGFPAHAGEWGVIAESGKALATISRTVEVTDSSHYLELRATATAADPEHAGYRIAIVAEVAS